MVEHSRKELEDLGFTLAGDWRLQDGNLDFVLHTDQDMKPVLYAFIVSGAVKYIGKSIRTLKERMLQYKTPGPSQRTNKRNHKLLMEALLGGETTEILVLHPDPTGWEYRGVQINIAAGLEDPLIDRFAPPWNGQRDAVEE